MASINSHRKRQAYSRDLYSRGNMTSPKAAPCIAATIMPSKNTRGQDYYAYGRTFADLQDKLQRSYVGNALRKHRTHTPGTGTITYEDKILTSPAGMGNLYDDDNHLRFYFRQYNNTYGNAAPIIYSSEYSAAGWVLNYSRRYTGLINNGHHSHKSIRVKGSSSYCQVMALGDHIGGNIKSRHTALKWIGGMWKEKP